LNATASRGTVRIVSAVIVEQLIADHRGEMLGFARRRAGHLVDPEDVVQEASIRALARADQLRDAARGRAWLFRILRNVLTDELRKLGVPAREPIGDPPDDGEPPSEACRCALALAKTLKPEYAAILERAVIDDVPLSTVAGELGVTANNATVRLHRARRALREVLQEHCGTASLRACLTCACDERGCCATR
jgi:RNA polymerase sigma-70 factor (ECF subfamily)